VILTVNVPDANGIGHETPVPGDAKGRVMVGGVGLTGFPSGTGQTIAAVTGAPVSSAASPAGTCSWYIAPETDCWVEIGNTPTAVAGQSTRLFAGVPVFLPCLDGDLVSVLAASAAGNVHARPYK